MKALNLFVRWWVVVSLLIVLYACSSDAGAPRPPITWPLMRNEPVGVESEFSIKKSDLYAMILAFNIPKNDTRERIYLLGVGDKSVSARHAHGKSFAVRVAILKRGGGGFSSILEKSIATESLGFTSWNSESLRKELIAFNLDPGEYKILAEIVDFDDAMRGVKLDLELVRPYRGK